MLAIPGPHQEHEGNPLRIQAWPFIIAGSWVGLTQTDRCHGSRVPSRVTGEQAISESYFKPATSTLGVCTNSWSERLKGDL